VQTGAPVRFYVGVGACPVLGHLVEEADRPRASPVAARRGGSRLVGGESQDVDQGGVDVERGDETACGSVEAEICGGGRVPLGEGRRKPDGEVGQPFVVLAVSGAPRVIEARSVVGQQDKNGAVEVSRVAQRRQMSPQVVVGERKSQRRVVTELGVKDEGELAAVDVAIEKATLPREHVDMSRRGTDAERTEVGVATLDGQVERSHVVINRLMLETEHSIRESEHASYHSNNKNLLCNSGKRVLTR